MRSHLLVKLFYKYRFLLVFIEDVWAGGGNLGPSIEYFINGLEVGNMVFMQYKTFPDGTREELPIKVFYSFFHLFQKKGNINFFFYFLLFLTIKKNLHYFIF